MKSRLVRIMPVLWFPLMAGIHHPVVHAGRVAQREVVIAWHYPHARLRVADGLPAGTVISSVAIPLPQELPAGTSVLSTATVRDKEWVMLNTSLDGLKVRAAIDRNGGPRADGKGMQTLLRLELVTDEGTRSGWLTVPSQLLWWDVLDPVTLSRLWRARIVWKGRLKVETGNGDEQDDSKRDSRQ
ncbi:MAG: hypothetical protein E7E83_00755 [Enterobacter ludwigii]|nr:hypothetical protein [Enterobacter ludwigii]